MNKQAIRQIINRQANIDTERKRKKEKVCETELERVEMSYVSVKNSILENVSLSHLLILLSL